MNLDIQFLSPRSLLVPQKQTKINIPCLLISFLFRTAGLSTVIKINETFNHSDQFE